MYICVSLSLSIYIYIYTYTYIDKAPVPSASEPWSRCPSFSPTGPPCRGHSIS